MSGLKEGHFHECSLCPLEIQAPVGGLMPPKWRDSILTFEMEPSTMDIIITGLIILKHVQHDIKVVVFFTLNVLKFYQALGLYTLSSKLAL